MTKTTVTEKAKYIDWSKKRNSFIWHELLCPETEIRDPDGWDRRSEYWYNSFYIEEISLQEFVQRLCHSTTCNLNVNSWFMKEVFTNLT